MAFLERREKGWRLRWRGPDGKQRSHAVPTLSTAEELLASIEEAEARGRAWSPPAPRAPVEEGVEAVARRYLEARARALRPYTLEAYGESFDVLLRVLRERDARRTWRLSDLTEELLGEVYDHLNGRHGRPLAEVSRRRHLSVWWLLLEWAWPRLYPGQSPPPRLDLAAMPRPLVEAPTFEQIDAMLEALLEGQKAERRLWIWRLAVLARYTGGRRGELLVLRWAQVDLERAQLTLRPDTTKGGYGGRVVPLHPGLLAELRTWPRDGESVVGAPAIALEHVQGDDYGHISRTVARAWSRAGVAADAWRQHSLHCLRAAVRTHLVIEGVHPDVIDALLGHAGQGTGGRHYTARAALLPALRRAVELLPALARRESP